MTVEIAKNIIRDHEINNGIPIKDAVISSDIIKHYLPGEIQWTYRALKDFIIKNS